MSRSWKNRLSSFDGRGSRGLSRVAVVFAFFGLAWIACGPVTEPIEFSFSVLEVSFDSLPELGGQNLYKYKSATVDPDSLVRAILNARIPINEAWEPVQDTCAAAGDPVGPRLTVLITEPDARLTSHNFEPGNGIRPCTTRIRRFLIVRSFF
jgi:hypothetical protein